MRWTNHTSSITSPLSMVLRKPLVCSVFEAYIRCFVASLVLDEAIPTPRCGHFIQNASKLDYCYSLVATSTANHIENPVSSL
jgi:hypothetical protein